MKRTKRKAFNFLRSYFDVLNELKTDADKLNFLLSIINKQFLNEEPKDLNFIVNLCYESQRHQIESSVKGWERASNEALGTTPPTPLGTTPPTTHKEEKEKEEEKYILTDVINSELIESISMKKGIDLEIIETLATLFIENRELDKSHIEKSHYELRSWFINFVNIESKKHIKPRFEFCSMEWVKQKDLNPKRTYIKANNMQGYHGLMNTAELIKAGYKETDIVTIHNVKL